MHIVAILSNVIKYNQKSKKKKKSKELKVGDEWGKYGIINESEQVSYLREAKHIDIF